MLHFASRALRSVRRHWHRFGRDEKGSAIAFLAVLPVLAGAVAIGVETGQLYRLKRQMQSSADAAALAGTVDRMAGKTNATITATAQYEAQRNGFTNNPSGGVTVTVNAPPVSGANVNTPSAVEVIITKSSRFSLGAVLMNWLGGTPGTFNVSARSVAAQGTNSSTTTSAEACVVALTTAAEQGVSFTNYNNFNSDCTIASNGSSTSSSANASVYLSGGGATLKSVWTRGSLYSTGSLTLTNPAQTNQTTYVSDPYSNLARPSPGGCDFTNFDPGTNSSVTLRPGTYCKGLSIDGTVNTSIKNVYFTAGTYYIADGDLYMNHVNNVSCSDCVDGTSGVTIILTQTSGNNANIGGLFIASDNNVTLSAPPTGTYAGILAFQDPNATVGTMTSTAKIFSVSSLNNAKLSGAIYFPNNRIDLSNLNNQLKIGNSCTVWIGRYVKFANYNNNNIAGCGTFGTKAASVTTTTTVAKSKVLE